jgi:hypothetical protein
VAVWYLTSRVLMFVNLRAARAEERAADARTLLLTGAPAPPLGRRRRRPRHGAAMPDAGAGVVPDR